MPTVNGGSACVTTPWWSITAVAPVLVARIIGRCSSSERMREMRRCCSIAIVLPNQPMLLRLARIVGAFCAGTNRAASSSPNRSS